MIREKIKDKKDKVKEKRTKLKLLFFFLLFSLFSYLLLSCKQQELVWEPGRPFPKERIIIGVIHPNEIDSDSLYDQAQYTGTLGMQRRIGLEDSQIIRKTNVFSGDPVATEGAIRDCIAEGANIIIAMSWGYMDVCESLALEFPSVVFAHATGIKYNDRNFANYSIRLYQGRYLSGIVAGLKTQTNKIGFVGARGRDNSEVTGSINAFAMGVESVNPDARVYVQITHSFYDPMGETNAANALIAAGCDIITTHANTPAAQIAAERAGVWAIGYNADMYDLAPNAIITSVVLYWEVLYTQLVESVINGTFIPQTHFYGLREGAIDLTPINKELAPSEVEAAILAARQRIMHEGFNIFDGIIETNDGRTIGEGVANFNSTLTDEVILSGIDWYYRNVIEL